MCEAAFWYALALSYVLTILYTVKEHQENQNHFCRSLTLKQCLKSLEKMNFGKVLLYQTIKLDEKQKFFKRIQ